LNTVGFIGLGAMGLPIASNIVKGGIRVLGLCRSDSKTLTITEHGIQPCQSIEETVDGANTVFLSLPDPDTVLNVAREVFQYCKRGAYIIDLSSVDPSTSRKLYGEAVRLGLHYADAPVSGGVSGAQAGTLTVMFGGDTDDYEKL